MNSLQSMPKKCMAGLLVLTIGWQSALAQPSSAPSLGPASSSDLSPALERRLGEAIMVEGRRDPEYIKDPDLSQYLNAMGKRLASFAPGGAPDIEVFGVRDPVINAFAMPGGYIGVHTGLIVTSGAEAELAGVLAHEIAHVTQRHIARGLTQQQQSGHLAIATLVAAVLAGLTPGGGQAAMGIAAFGQAAAIAQQLGFSRDAEQEADRTGFEMLRKAGYDPNGMAVMFGRLMQASSLNEGRGGGVYVSTHPLSISRMTDMQNRIRQLPVAQYQASDEFWFVRAKARVVQAVDPRALVQAVENLQEEIRVNAKAGTTASGSAARQAAAWYGLSLAAAVRKDLKTAASTLEQALERQVHDRAAGAALVRAGRVAIEAVLADIEEEGRKVLVAEVGQRADVGVEVKVRHRLLQRCVELGQQRQHIALQLGHLRNFHPLSLAEPIQGAQQIAEGVAQLAVLVGHALEDFVPDPVVLGEIDRQRPQPDDVRAIGFHHLQRVDGVAQRLGHFHALLVHREAVGEDSLIRRMAARAAAFEQARLEPAAMLVAAFEIKVGKRAHIAFGTRQIGPLARFEHEGMR